jgi:hypothetical protein
MSFYQPVAPAGVNGQVQINDQRGFGATPDLAWDAGRRALDVHRLEALSLLSLSGLMLALATRGGSIGVAGQPLFGVGPAVSGTTPLGIGPHDYYPIDLASGSLM